MAIQPVDSEFRVEKIRGHATLTLATGKTLLGCFFLSESSAHLPGPERIGELLNTESGFVPFEVHDASGTPRVRLFNRAQIMTVTTAENEATQDPGYEVATEWVAAIHLSNGSLLVGAVRVYSPAGRDRLSDWAKHPVQFRYIECDEATHIVNVTHIVELGEVNE